MNKIKLFESFKDCRRVITLKILNRELRSIST